MKEIHSLITAWLEALEREGRSSLTIAAYRRALVHVAAWYREVSGAAFDPGLLLARDVRDWLAAQRSIERAAPASINQRLVALTRFYAWAVAQGHCRANPALGIRSVPLPAREPKGLDERALRRLLRAVHRSDNLRDIALVELLAGAGLRVGELLALQVGDVKLGERSGTVTIRAGKHGGYRVVPLTREVRTALTEWLAVHPAPHDPDAALWWSTRGPLRERSSVLRLLEKYAHQAEIPAFSPHQLRHTFATRYLAANPGDVRGLAALLGHVSLQTVMVYTEPTLEDLAARMTRVEGRE